MSWKNRRIPGVAALVVFLGVGSAQAAPFEADQNFGDRGRTVVDLRQDVSATEIVRDGRFTLVAASTPPGSEDEADGALVRINQRGRLKRSFGDEGVLDGPIEGPIHDLVVDRARDLTFVLLDNHVLALDPSGEVALGWGLAGESVVTFRATSLALAPGGAVIVSGDESSVATTDDEGDPARATAVATRLDAEGAIDQDYGDNGFYRQTRNCVFNGFLRCPTGGVRDSAVSPDGSLTLAGYHVSISGQTANGLVTVVDPGGDDVIADPAQPAECQGFADDAGRVTEDSLGESYVAGFCATATSYVLRPLLPEGETYGDDGTARVSSDFRIGDLAVDSLGRTVLVATNEDPRIMRLDASGEALEEPFKPKVKGVGRHDFDRVDLAGNGIIVAGSTGRQKLLIAKFAGENSGR